MQREKRLADRYKAVLCLNLGFSFEATAQVLMLDDNTVRAAYERYHSQGIKGLSQVNYT